MQGFQRRFLRGLAHPLKPVVWLGRQGLTAGLRHAVDQALTDHELIKVRMREPEDKKALAADLARGTRSELVGLIGHTVILYRPHPDRPQIELPRRPSSG